MPSDLQDWQTASVQPAVHLATVSVGPNGNTTTTLTPPAGTHGLALVSADSSGRLGVVNLIGHTTGAFYWAPLSGAVAALLGTMTILPIVLDPSFEAGLDLTLNSTYLAGAHNVEVFAVLDVEGLVTSSANPLVTEFTSAQATVPQAGTSNLPTGAYYSAVRSALLTGPTKSGQQNQATANGGVDLQLFALGAGPVIYDLDLTMVNTVTTGGSWATVRLHNATSSIDVWLGVLEADKNGSGFPYKTERSWRWVDTPLEPAKFGGGAADTWGLIVNASANGAFWGSGIRYA